MNILTACPDCNTVFRVPAEILAARDGQVRCGVCSCVFDAREYLTPEIYPNIDSAETPQIETSDSTAAEPLNSLDEQAEVLEIGIPATDISLTPAEEITPPIEEQTEGVEISLPAIDMPAEPAEEITPSVKDSEHVEEPEQRLEEPASPIETPVEWAVEPSDAEPPRESMAASLPADALTNTARLVQRKRLRSTLLGIGSAALALLLAAQLVYLMRTPIAARIPAVKPWLVTACMAVGCNVPLPHDSDAIKISSSDLLSDPAHPARIQVSLLIANEAGYAEAYPHIELTLTDTHDAPLAKRIFAPTEYLRTPGKEAAGIRPGSEASVDLLLDIGNLAATGYRVLVFYP
ncbi:MAG: zinc-ribbon and DUF3426 domain-containing protein [Sulfuriferula sp.]